MAWLGKKPADVIASGQTLAPKSVTADRLADGAAVANVGYTPVNKAGDTMTGTLNISGFSSQFPEAIVVPATTHSTSRRAGIILDQWSIVQDRNGDGIRDFGIYGGNSLFDFVLNIDTAGRVTMPHQPHFRAFNPTSASVAISSGKVSGFSSVDSNVGGHYNGTNSRFTAPVDGVYIFVLNLFGIAGDDRYSIGINGSGPLGNPYVTNLHSGAAVSGSFVIRLNQSDYVEVFAQYGTSSLFGSHSGWMGYLLG